ncbi:MAG: hypothetical protein WD845_07955 [Pirellulales bacterium]
MGGVTHGSMHQDHKQWLSDNDMWRLDIANWQAELREAESSLQDIEAAIKDHTTALQTHAASVRMREQALRAHEHALAEYEQGETGAELIALVEIHRREAADHLQQTDAHERIKRHHHQVIAHLRQVRKALAAAE